MLDVVDVGSDHRPVLLELILEASPREKRNKTFRFQSGDLDRQAYNFHLKAYFEI